MKSMKKMVKKIGESRIVTVSENKITREPVTRKVVHREQKKSYQLVYDKRIIINRGKDTLPYGYTWRPRDNDESVTIDRDQVTYTSHHLADLKIYSEHYAPCIRKDTLGELFPYDNESEMTDDIDLMVTSESEESDDELTNADSFSWRR
jgi:predicted SPOUT superfamily RNA methylase MTH1